MIYSAVVRAVMLPVLILLMVVLPVSITAQTTTADSEVSPEPAEEPPDWIHATDIQPDADSDWVRTEGGEPPVPAVGPQAVIALRAQALAIDLDAKARVLATLQGMHEANQLSRDDRPAVDLIAYLATESYDFQVRRDGRVINNFPMIRAEAVRLLGSVGGPVSTATIERVLNHETDTFVLSQAVTAAAQAAPEPTPELLATLTTLVNRMNALRRPDNALAAAVINAVNDLHERSSGIDDPDLFRALISIAQGGYSTTVRRAAIRVIDTLRQQPQP